MKEPSERIQKLLKTVIDEFNKEDFAIRERQILKWKRLKLLWESFSRVWYSEVAHDWRIWDESSIEESDSDQAYYDKPVNVFRAYLESIIAALSVTVPPVKSYPDDADNTLDLATAKAGDKIAALIFRHNDAPLLWLHALFVFCTEGMIACYSYPKADKKYGTYEVKTTKDELEEHEYTRCPECGYDIDDQQLTPELLAIKEKLAQSENSFQPGPEDVELQNIVQNEPQLEECPNCLEQIAPLVVRENLIIERLVGTTNEPKSRICMEVYGGLNVKVPNYARTQEECPYLRYSYETNYVNAMEDFQHLQGKDKKDEIYKKIRESTGPHDPYEQWGRLNPQYNGEYPTNVVTMNNWWLRPCAFNVLPDEADIKELKKEFPNGVKVRLVNDCFGDAKNEALDDCWTLDRNPLADHLHHDPLGLLLVSIQEITNDLISLILQTIEHGIPQTFADPGVLDFPAYRQTPAIPGAIYEAKPKTGKAVSDAFYEVKTATLSQEIMPFAQNIQSLAQLVSGALPSLFGGQIEAGSGTASEYSMSRAQALQRLQSTWKVLIAWWKTIFGKAIPMYIAETKNQDDERDVQRSKDGSFINIVIHKADLEGKIGKVELEANENLPMTWSQQKDVWMQLLQASNPAILDIMAAPENLPIMRNAIGLNDVFVPGEDDKDKQNDEIRLLLNSEPLPNPEDIEGTMPELPSVEIEPDYDNHKVHFEICRKWIISEEGRQAKSENEPGYRNVLLHGKLHLMQIQMQMMQEQMATEGKGVVPSEKPNQLNRETPIQGEENVSTIQ
jgi:hypothetical protein